MFMFSMDSFLTSDMLSNSRLSMSKGTSGKFSKISSIIHEKAVIHHKEPNSLNCKIPKAKVAHIDANRNPTLFSTIDGESIRV